MKGIIMIFLKEKKIKNLEELESLWKWRILEFGDDVIDILEEKEMKDLRVLGKNWNEEFDSLWILFLEK